MKKNNDVNIYKNYITWIIIACFFILMLAVFLIFGEINLSKLNWFVAENGRKWGLIQYDDGKLLPVDKQYMGFGVNSGPLMVNGFIFLIMFSILFIGLILNLILVLKSLIKFSSIAFTTSSWVVFFTIIVTGLLYPGKNDNFPWQIVVRIVLVLISYPLFFFPLNFLLKKMFINTKYGEEYVANLLSTEKENAKYINEIEKLHIHDKNDETFVEIDANEKW